MDSLFETDRGAELKHLPVSSLHPHPNNPRIDYDSEVVQGIAHTLKKSGHFDESHALLVRPRDDGYEIVSGHHRWQAAKQVGMEEVPVWVRSMDDITAHMKLVTENNQSELSRLEIGLHALDTVGRGKRGRGNAGDGLKAYAERIGVDKRSLSRWVAAAEVYKRSPRGDLLRQLQDVSVRALHEISKAPEALWQSLLEQLVEQDWSVRDTKHFRQKVEEFDIPDRWAGVFLDPRAVVETYLKTKEFSPQTVDRLVDLADNTLQRIETYDVDADDFRVQFKSWLSENAGERASGSWDTREITKYQRELQAQLEKAERAAQRSWANANWRDAIHVLEDDDARLVLTDPPYGIDYQSDRRTDRRKERRHNVLQGDTEDAADELYDCLRALRQKLAEDAHVLVFTQWRVEPEMRAAIHEAGYELRGSLVWAKNNRGMGDRETTFAPKHERILHAVKGSPVLFNREPDVLHADRVDSDRHPTEKPTPLLRTLIECTTTKGELVLDPFGGVASTLVSALELDRRAWGAELDADYHRVGKSRIDSIR